jgi:methylenetetrahydrofolate reductase (NADPH)
MASDQAVMSTLLREASIEINAADSKHLEASREWLSLGTRVFVSHLPNQTWEQTRLTAAAARQVGYDPVPHIPVRLLSDRSTLDHVLGELAQEGVQELLLIAGDCPEPKGPYGTVSDILHTGLLGKHGFRRVALAGHPEGHAKVDRQVMRQAERDKARLAHSLGLETSLVTQFFFEAKPFLDWAGDMRRDEVPTRLVAGLAGPASAAALMRFALRCGVGPSVRALGAKPGSMLKLMGDHGPDDVLAALAEARLARANVLDGVHFFCFGGFLRTCRWVHEVAAGRRRPE